ncbi:MAG: phytochrome sensor protein [Verrucomicrobiaceae bacterium]|nr:phytochrome sensor protein [Verrucomicrobiaceae bacterium]
MQSSRTSTSAALGTMIKIVITALIMAALYFGREILIPLAMAALLTVLLTPLVVRLERWIGRIAAVLVALVLLISFAVGIGSILAGQMINLAEKLPDYKENIRSKLQVLKMPQSGHFAKFADMVTDLKRELPGGDDSPKSPGQASKTLSSSQSPAADAAARPASPENGTKAPEAGKPAPPPPPAPVQVVETKKSSPMETAAAIISPIMGPLGTTALVLLLMVCMLLQRESLRSRLTRLIGRGNITTTRRALDDAFNRVSRYLLMQFLVNTTYGVLVATGLYFIGVPNVLVWGVLAMVLRFIPYVGPWIAASFPILLSLAVASGWTMLLTTLGMFVVIELLFANAVEPWLYGSHTGVSAFALILAAVFWTWMWGAAGLVLATPLTVCLVVMARHVPDLAMLGVLLSDEEPLAPHEEFYHRLLSPEEKDAGDFAESFVKANSHAAFYDSVFIGALSAIEKEYQAGELDTLQLQELQGDMRDVIEDVASLPLSESKEETDNEADASVGRFAAPLPTCRVLCLPARAARDGIAASMLAQLLEQRHFSVESLSVQLTTGELIEAVVQDEAEVLCISAVAPTTILQTRYLCGKLHARCPQLRIIVGLWGAAEDMAEATKRLRDSGAEEVVTTFTGAVASISRYASMLSQQAGIQSPSLDETARLQELEKLQVIDTEIEPEFERVTKKLARVLNAPIALVSLITSDRQFFKSQHGLPADLAKSRSIARQLSVCSQLVASNKPLVVEDLARDRRFSSNPLLRELKLRFYAGVPLRTASGHAVGSLCILDYKPRKFGDHENRLLEVTAEEVMELMDSRQANNSDFEKTKEPKAVLEAA